jgi:hypothetical protein
VPGRRLTIALDAGLRFLIPRCVWGLPLTLSRSVVRVCPSLFPPLPLVQSSASSCPGAFARSYWDDTWLAGELGGILGALDLPVRQCSGHWGVCVLLPMCVCVCVCVCRCPCVGVRVCVREGGAGNCASTHLVA